MHREAGAALYTDALQSYDGLAQEYAHDVIDHADRYVDGQVHTNGLENFWSLLKRGLNGTYISVEPFHLFRYLDEQVWRYNNRATRERPMNDGDRFQLALSQVAGKRLTFAEVTGKDGKISINLEKVRAQKTLLPIHQHARGGNDEGYQEIEKDFGSQAKSERLGKQHVQLISNRQHTTDNSSKQAISLENSRAEHKAQGARQ